MVCSGCDKSKYLKTAGEIWPRQTRTSEGLEPFISTRKPCKEITIVFNQKKNNNYETELSWTEY